VGCDPDPGSHGKPENVIDHGDRRHLLGAVSSK
jgi:hypothetical protein